MPIQPQLTRDLNRQGYAWASSGYRSQGYRLDWFVVDTLALRAFFIREIGPLHWTIIHSVSMDGHVAIASLESPPASIRVRSSSAA